MQNIRSCHPQESVIECFRRHKLKVTPQRLAVYKLIGRSKEHPTAEQVYMEMRDEFPSVSYDTVNRTLNLFARIGLVDRVEGFGAARRYDADTGAHHHLVCLNCGRIIDFKNSAYDRLEVPPELNELFEVVGRRVVLSGVCADCGGQ